MGGGGGVANGAEGVQNRRAPGPWTDTPRSILGTVLSVLGCAVTDSVASIPAEQWLRESN